MHRTTPMLVLARLLRRPLGRVEATIDRVERDGLAFAFRARSFAVAAVSIWLLVIVPWPRNAYYLALAAALFLFGYVPFRLRDHPFAFAIKLVFILLDVGLVAAAILMPPPGGLAVGWPVQTRTRGPEFLYLILLLGEAAMTYSPFFVAWTGSWIAAIWIAGVSAIYALPTTTGLPAPSSDRLAGEAATLRAYFSPTAVVLSMALTQVIAALILTTLLAFAVGRGRQHLVGGIRAETLRADFARYVSPDVAQVLTDRVASGFGEPTERHVAVLFADVVGFTSATETLAPSRTFALLRSFQERSSAKVLAFGGTIDKYLGDGLMATFGALRDEEDAPARAVACASALLEEIERWNTKRQGRDAVPLRVAVGVHCGMVTVGNLGSERRMEFTVVGDVVNVASRLEKAARELGCRMVVSDDCLRMIPDVAAPSRFTRCVELRLRGRGAPLKVHLAGCDDAA